MPSPHANGREIPNQFIIFVNHEVYFQSKEHILAMMDEKRVFLDKKHWDCKGVNRKYLLKFLGDDEFNLLTKVANKVYKLVDLNKEL